MQAHAPQTQRGNTLLEYLIGLAISLGLVAAALAWLADQTRLYRDLLGQARLQQELVLLSGLLASELRRTGPNTAPSFSPQAVQYSTDGAADNRFSLSQGHLLLRLGQGSNQTLSDEQAVTITAFEPTPITAAGGVCGVQWQLEAQLTRQPQLRQRLTGATPLLRLNTGCSP